MTDKMKKDMEIFVESYNDFLREGYVSYIKDSGTYEDEQSLLDVARDVIILNWEQNPLKELDNMTPIEFINSIDDIEDMLEIFEYMSLNTFDFIPKCFIEKIVSYGDEAAKCLLDRIDIDVLEEKSIEDIDTTGELNRKLEIALVSVEVFSKPGFGGTDAIEKLIQVIDRSHPGNVLFFEKAADALAKRGKESADLLIKEIKDINILEERYEYLLSTLCNMDDSVKNDEIYKCLKKSFLKMNNRIMGAAFLGDYNDSRAIPLLRRFAKENSEKLTREEYYTILGTISKLGGIIEDLIPGGFLQ